MAVSADLGRDVPPGGLKPSSAWASRPSLLHETFFLFGLQAGFLEPIPLRSAVPSTLAFVQRFLGVPGKLSRSRIALNFSASLMQVASYSRCAFLDELANRLGL